MAGGGSSSSKPVDMTPKAFKSMQGPFAAVIASLLGYGAPGGPSNGTGWGPTGNSGTKWGFSPNGQIMQGTSTGGNMGVSSGSQFGGSGGMMQTVLRNGASNKWGYGGSEVGGNAGHMDPGYVNRSQPVQQSSGGTPLFFPNSGDPNDILNGIPTYKGKMVEEIGANEQSILDQLMNTTGSGTAGQQAGPSSPAMEYLHKVLQGEFMPGAMDQGGLTGFAQMLKGSRQETGYSTDEMNPFLNAAIEAAQRPTLQGLEETLTRSLPGRFTQAGQFTQPRGSSAFDRAGAIATRGASDALADIATNLSYATMEAERGRQFEAQEGARSREDAAMREELGRSNENIQNERNRQNEAAGLTTTVQAQEVDTLVKNLQAQALPRLIKEFGIERGMEQFNNQLNTLLGVLGIGAGVTAPVIGQSSESKTKPNLMPLAGLGG